MGGMIVFFFYFLRNHGWPLAGLREPESPDQIFNFISSTGVPLTASSPVTNNVVPLISWSLTSWIPILESLSGVREANTPTCLPSSPRLKDVLTERDLCR